MDSLEDLAARTLEGLERHEWNVGTAESLTGGMICSTLVDIPGASQVVKGAVVAYAADVKIATLGVSADLIAEKGTVNPDVARQMAEGAASALDCEVAIAATGVAGPGPAEGCQPGDVHLAVRTPRGMWHRHLSLSGNRDEIRRDTVREALNLIIEALEW